MAHKPLKGHWPLSALSVLRDETLQHSRPQLSEYPGLRLGLGWLWPHMAQAVLLGQVHGSVNASPVAALGLQSIKSIPYRGGGVRVADYPAVPSSLFKSSSLSFEVSLHPHNIPPNSSCLCQETKVSDSPMPASRWLEKQSSPRCITAITLGQSHDILLNSKMSHVPHGKAGSHFRVPDSVDIRCSQGQAKGSCSGPF